MIVEVKKLHYSYKGKKALNGIDLSVLPKQIFGLLGPNGSGKTTLFRILATLLLPEQGTVTICGNDVLNESMKVRRQIGIVFQSPSLDPKLTVEENIHYQGHLYGLSGKKLKERADEMMKRLNLLDRRRDIVSKLSGGLKRRVELAKGLLHSPKLLILDEPSSGLDPGARIDLWNYLKQLRDQEGMTVLVTTHLMEEAEHCDHLMILSHGQVVGSGSPDALKQEVGQGVVVLKGKQIQNMIPDILQKFKVEAKPFEDEIQIEHAEGPMLAARILEAFPGQIESVTFRRPTLEDVFIHKTGHRFWSEKS